MKDSMQVEKKVEMLVEMMVVMKDERMVVLMAD